MKPIFTSILAVFSLFMVISCNGDDDSQNTQTTNADLIVGTWNMTANTVDDGNATATVQGFPIAVDFTWKGKDYDYQLTFDEEEKVGERGGFTLLLTYSTLLQSMTREIPLQTGDGSGTLLLSGGYEISNDKLTVKNDGETVTAIIDELTETTLRFSIDLGKVPPQLINGAAENISGTNKITFLRQ